MVTETQHHALIDESTAWHDHLLGYCNQINAEQTTLYRFAAGKTAKELLVEIEHFHNQFHIQLINLHDLKHEVRYHLGQADRVAHFSLRAPHHLIKEKYDALLKSIDKLILEFHQFIQRNP